MDHDFFSYLPCFPHKAETLISSALNNHIHRECLNSTTFYPELLIRFNTFLESELEIENEDLKKISNFIDIQEEMFEIHDKVKRSVSKTNI